jgi:NADPH:quinone reductase-like Zn-dependent oxidoreductase
MAARVRELAPGGVDDAVFDHLGGASVGLSCRLLNPTGTLVSYSIVSKLDDTSPVLLGFLVLMARLAVWNYLPTRKHASFHNVWAGAGQPDSARREAFRAGCAPTSRTSSACCAKDFSPRRSQRASR